MLSIIQATYGVVSDAKLRRDVTAVLQGQVDSAGRLSIPQLSNDLLGGDPAPGKPKQLQVKYRYEGGHEKMVLVAENGALHLEPPHAPSGGPSAAQAPVPAVRAPAESYKGQVASYAPSRAHAAQPLVWESVDGQLRVNGRRFHLKGTNYFGFETDNRYPHGLWQVKLSSILDFVEQHKFNAIRLPFSLTMALDLGKVNDKWVEDEDLRGVTGGELLSRVVDRFGERGILIMLDMHRLDEQKIPELWYDEHFTEADLLRGWDNVLDICKDKWNVFACDLKNEPHGEARWGKQCDKDWNVGAEIIANHIIQNHPEYKGLFFIEGINEPANMSCDSPCPHATWWGGSFEGLHKAPINLTDPDANNKRIVFSPHVYGPSVFMQDYFKVPGFPKNLPDIWMAHWGFAKQHTGRAVVIGEWGGWYNTPEDKAWQNALADFLVAHDFTDQFYWCLNPNSGDTGGLLEDDWVTPVKPKLELLARVQPHPTRITRHGGDISFTEEAN